MSAQWTVSTAREGAARAGDGGGPGRRIGYISYIRICIFCPLFKYVYI